MGRQTNAGEEIREARKAIGLSKEGLAYKAGVALSTIERIEAGKVTPRRATLSVIRAVLAEEAV
jgi:predicted transcriptional regulator